jgi:hypothetical protein
MYAGRWRYWVPAAVETQWHVRASIMQQNPATLAVGGLCQNFEET